MCPRSSKDEVSVMHALQTENARLFDLLKGRGGDSDLFAKIKTLEAEKASLAVRFATILQQQN